MYNKCESFELGDTREECLRVPAHLEPLDLSGGTGNRRTEWQKETKSRLGRRRMTSGENEGRSPPWQGGLSEGLIDFCFYLSGLPIDRISIQLLKNLSFRLTWTDQPIDRTGGICNAIWRAFCVLSSHVASGNSFNASLFLIQFRDYPKEVDCRKANKKKEKKEEEEKLKKVNTSWRAGRVDERCTIGGGNETKILLRIEKDFNEQKNWGWLSNVTAMSTYQPLRYVLYIQYL